MIGPQVSLCALEKFRPDGFSRYGPRLASPSGGLSSSQPEQDSFLQCPTRGGCPASAQAADARGAFPADVRPEDVIPTVIIRWTFGGLSVDFRWTSVVFNHVAGPLTPHRFA